MEPLKDAEQLAGILHVEAHAVVADEHDDLVGAPFDRADLDDGLGPRLRVLHGVFDEVGEHLPDHGAVGLHLGKRADAPFDGAAGGVVAQLRDDLLHDRPKRHARGLDLRAGHLREPKQLVDEHAHALGALANLVEITAGRHVQLGRGVLDEQIGESVDMPERRAQVVRDRIGERFQFPVGGLELLVDRLHLLRALDDLGLHPLHPGDERAGGARGGRFLLHECGHVLDAMDDELELASGSENGGVDRAPVALHERAVGLADVVLLDGHGVGRERPSYPIERGAQVGRPRGGGVVGVVRERVEDVAAAKVLASGHRRIEIGGIRGHDVKIGREDQVRAGERFEQAFEDGAAAAKLDIRSIEPHGAPMDQRGQHDDRCDHEEGGARGPVVIPGALTQKAQPAQRDGNAQDGGHQPPRHRPPRRVARQQTRKPLVGTSAKNPETQREEDRGGVHRHADVTGKPVERAGVVGVADEGKQREEAHRERQILSGAAPPAGLDVEQRQRRADEDARHGGVRRHPVPPAPGHDLELVRVKKRVHAPVPPRQIPEQTQRADRRHHECACLPDANLSSFPMFVPQHEER